MTAQVDAPEVVCRRDRGDTDIPPVPAVPPELEGEQATSWRQLLERENKSRNNCSFRRDLWCLCNECILSRMARDWVTVAKVVQTRSEMERVAESQRAARAALRVYLADEDRWGLFYHYGMILLNGSDDRSYHLTFGVSGNIYRHEGGIRFSTWCCHPSEFVTTENCMLGQALALTTDAPRFLNTAVANGITFWE